METNKLLVERRSKALKKRLGKLIAQGKLNMDLQAIDTYALSDTLLTLDENYKSVLKELHYAEEPKQEDYATEAKEHILEIENKYEQEFKKSITELKSGEQEIYFKTLKDYVNIVSKGFANSLIIEGTGGLGKTHEVLKTLSESGIEWEYINSYSTPLSFYQLLYEKNNKVLVLDDITGLLNTEIGISILKGALWGVNDKRYISYYSTSDKLTIPNKFEFTGKIIFLVNSLKNNPELDALKTRALYCKLDFSFEDIKKIIMAIAKGDNRQEVAEYIIEIATPATKELNLRTLIKGYSIYEYAKSIGQDWKNLIDKLLETDEEKAMVLKLHKECGTAKLEIQKWVELTGRSARTYYRLKKEMGLTRAYK